MKQRFGITWVVLALIFFVSALLASLKPSNAELPFSSYSVSGDGTKAAYLLLSELGFNVLRKTVSIDEWNTEGIIIALGPDYLMETEQDLIFHNSELFTNRAIRQNANVFLVKVFPYKESTIIFDEYGRSRYPLYNNTGDLIAGKPSSLWDIMPDNLRLLFLNLSFIAFCIMFFYKQRVGEAISPEGFSGRNPMEGINAMANAMHKARVFKDALGFYYKFQAEKNKELDIDGSIGASVKSVQTERAAFTLISEIDKLIKT